MTLKKKNENKKNMTENISTLENNSSDKRQNNQEETSFIQNWKWSLILGAGMFFAGIYAGPNSEEKNRLNMIDREAEYVVKEMRHYRNENYAIYGKNVTIGLIWTGTMFADHQFVINVNDSVEYYSEGFANYSGAIDGPDDDVRNLAKICVKNDYGYFVEYSKDKIPKFYDIQENYRDLILEISTIKRNICAKKETPVLDLESKIK